MNTTPIRLDDEFKKMLKALKVERIKRGIDNEPQSERRLSKAIARFVSGDIRTFETLVNSPLENDRAIRRRK